jgi:hypothetical protein
MSAQHATSTAPPPVVAKPFWLALFNSTRITSAGLSPSFSTECLSAAAQIAPPLLPLTSLVLPPGRVNFDLVSVRKIATPFGVRARGSCREA